MRQSSLVQSVAVAAVVAVVVLAGCSADRRPAEAPPRGPSEPAATAAGGGMQQPGYAQPTPGYPPPPPAQPGQPGQPVQPDSSSSSSFAKPPSREAALGQATNDVESSQRELDVAGSSCSNACRALGSMDRAAGRLCSLAQSTDETRKCTDAKTRVYSARDKVKNTCGSCPDTSVDRTAPIPSK